MTETIQLFNDSVINLRFDIGTARIIKDLTGTDPLANEQDADEVGSVIFLAGYKRYNDVFKIPAIYSDNDVKEYFFTLDRADALRVLSSFNAAMSVKKVTPEELINQTIATVEATNISEPKKS